MVTCTAFATQQNSLIGSIPKIKFFHWSRQCHQYLGPYFISPNQRYSKHAPHIYIYIYVIHLTVCGRIFEHTILKVQYNKKRNTNSREQAEPKALCDNSMSFTPFLPKPSPHTLHIISFQDCNSLLPK